MDPSPELDGGAHGQALSPLLLLLELCLGEDGGVWVMMVCLGDDGGVWVKMVVFG